MRIRMKDGTFLDQQKECVFCGTPVTYSYLALSGKLIAQDDEGNAHYPHCHVVAEEMLQKLNANPTQIKVLKGET